MAITRSPFYLWLALLTVSAAVFLGGAAASRADTSTELSAARERINQGDFEGALAKYQAILETDPPVEAKCEALFRMGTILEHIKQEDRAIASFESLVALNQDYRWPEVLHRLAVRYLYKGDRTRAEALIQELRRRRDTTASPTDRARADLLIADWFKAIQDWPKAMEYYQSILGKYAEHDKDVLFALGDTAQRAGRYDAAARALQEYVDKYPDSSQFELAATKLITAIAATDNGWEKALDVFEGIKAEHPGQVEQVMFNTGMAAHDAGRYDIAARVLKDYAGRYPDSPRFAEAAFRLVEDCMKERDYSDAILFLSEVSGAHPKLRAHATVLTAGIMAEGMNDVGKSTALAQQVVSENSDPYEVFLANYRIGLNYLYYCRDTARARPFLERALEAYPKDNLAVEIAGDIAESYNLEGDHLKAAQLYAQALEKFPCLIDDIAAHHRYMAGCSYLAASDLKAAKKAWDELAVKHPTSEWTKEARMEETRWAK